ncbi:flagellin-like protein [Oleiphilus messinensis]|uniref:Flagellin n=1 Tax=Oleiphilus messinensis TaxID=141451 RepID=A0A1Y0IBL1_9GAMM|nr:flagellin [Oleiphilus messinensis]ARU57156.1 flagellin-like protein [Oleiphilus messinensis]
MPQIINTNLASISAQRNLDNSQRAGDQALQRLSSGLRINGAKDDAAGLAISNRLTAQIRGTNVASRNAGDGVSLAQTAEGALNSMRDSLQRIRELALQSANGSNTDLERSSLQEEVDQLKSEIAAISEKTNFNGQKLLDGSFQDKVFQTGANVGETISVSVAKVTQDTLGTALSNGISTSSTSSAMIAGDVTINGVGVGAASAASDGASTTLADRSAISVAAAINAVSDESGVTAVADATTIKGSNTANVAAAGALTINGVTMTLAGSASATNLAADLQGVADTINSFAGQTGVTASIDINNLTSGVTLTAEDGRNIELGSSGATWGLAAAGTTTGTVSLISEDGTDFEIGSNTGNSLENAGIEVGTYSGSNSGVNGGAVTATALVAGDLTINGVSVGASLATDDVASSTSKDSSAISKAAAINRVSDQTGVTATAQNTQVLSGAVTVGAVSGMILNAVTINDIAAAATGDIGGQMSNIVDAINQKSAQTGIRAEIVDSDQYQLIADDGRNIEVNAVGAASGGLTAATTRASITLESAGQINIGTANATGPVNAGFSVGSFGGGETGTLLKDIDISTVAGANDAIKGIDNAINQVSRVQAQLGAVQNRFEATISNLAVQGENLSASNSRIQDADFAAETAELSRTQVLQQAGISVLAQANSRPQQALSLLQ